ncbi:MAG TPA: acyltransferase [Syntrophomonas sp.]|nr:acyltransferase [Syntrophomonas sp.]
MILEQERLQEFDLLRTVAALTVIGIHVSASYVYTSIWGCLANQFARFAVPLFIIMSGFLLFNADQRRDSFSAADFYRRRFGKILWPYFLWSLFYCCLTSVIGADFPSGLLRLPSQLLWGNAYYHLYFVIIIIQMYILYPLLYRWLLRSPRLCLLTALALTLVCQLILNAQNRGEIIFSQTISNLFLVVFPVWIFFFVFGMVAALYHKSWSGFLRDRRLGLGLLWAFSLALVIGDGYINNIFGSSSRPTVTLYTVCSYFFFYSLARHYHGHFRAAVDWISRQSFLIYLLHPVVLTALVTAAGILGYPGLWDRTWGMIALYLLVTLLSCAAVYVVSLTPLAEKLGGARR